ncbi:MAG: hemolysin [Chloroflexi bacterium RBG_16_60_22]|nr:MAG: hemolysin [Chloroflexi bacterium RBG_16_60_22]
MGGQELTYLILIIVFIGLTAFFCSSETSFLALQRVRLEHLVSTGVRGARLVAGMVERPEKLLSVVLLGINISNTAAAALVTALAVSIWGERGIIIATVGITIVILIFAEATPKTFAANHPERMALLFVRPLQLVSWVLTPFVSGLSWIAAWFARLAGGTPVGKTLASPEEIRTMISVGHKEGTVEEHEARLLHRVFEFGDRPVYEVMIPRPEVVAITQGSTVADFLRLYTEKPLSRFPVYKENMDNVVGILSVKDVLMALARGTATEESTIDELTRPAYFTPESKRIDELFAEMRDDNYRMAVVIDEYGGTAGIVSLSRLVEEIVGEVGDELAGVEKDYEIINEYTFQIDGSMRIDEANEEMELDLPEGEDYETVAGFILSLLGHIPRRHEQLRYRGMKMVITEMRGMKVEKIMLTKERQDAARRTPEEPEKKAKNGGG